MVDGGFCEMGVRERRDWQSRFHSPRRIYGIVVLYRSQKLGPGYVWRAADTIKDVTVAIAIILVPATNCKVLTLDHGHTLSSRSN